MPKKPAKTSRKPVKNWEMEISITPAGEEPSQCRCCGRWVPSDYCRRWVEVWEKPDVVKSPLGFALCEICVVTALRRVYEYSGLGRGVSGVPADRLTYPYTLTPSAI